MSNLDVALRVKLLADLGGPARKAERDLNGISRALDGVKRSGNGSAPASLAGIAPAAERAKRNLGGVAREARLLEQLRPGRGVGDSLKRAAEQAKLTQRELDLTSAKAKQLENAGSGSLGGLKKGMGDVGDKAGVLDKNFVNLGASAKDAFSSLLAFAAPAAIISGLNEVEKRVTALDRKYASLAVTAELRDPAVIQRLRQQDTAIGLKYGMKPEQVQPLRSAFVAGGVDLDTAQKITDPSARAVKAMDASPENIAQTVIAGIQNLNLTPDQIPAYLDQIAKGTKLGRFEADSVAKFMPQFGASYQGMGYTGLDASAEINALAQIVRQGSGTADAAGNNLANLFQKVFSPDAVKNFKEKGVDLRDVYARAQKEGKSYVSAILETVDKKTKGGDPFLVSELFGDAEVQNALRATLPNLKQLDEWVKAIRNGSAGTVEKDWQFLAETPAEKQAQADASAAQKLDSWAPLPQKIKLAWKRTLDDLYDPMTPWLGSKWLPRPDAAQEEQARRREQQERRATGAAAARDMPGYTAASKPLDLDALRKNGADAGFALDRGLRSTGPEAVKTMDDLMRQIEQRGSVTITPRIRPQIEGGVTVEPMSFRPAPRASEPTPGPSAPAGRGASLGGRGVTQNFAFNIRSTDPARTAREVDRRLARLSTGASALHDLV